MTTNELAKRIRENVSRVMVGKEAATELLLVAYLTGGHALIEDVPGSGKTKLAKSFARSAGCSFGRIQFTPDLLPSDITGVKYFNMKTSEFEFIPGPIFTNILLADELNRATPKTQSGLLECMEERQVTTDGETRPLPSPFMVIATENPVESMGVFPLPEAELDRFLLKIPMSYPTKAEGVEILKRFDGADPFEDLSPVCTKNDSEAAAREVAKVFVHPDLYGYIYDIVSATGREKDVSLGAGPRASIGLMTAAKGLAAVRGRDFVTPDDIKYLAVPVLAHRIITVSSFDLDTPAAEAVVKEVVAKTPVPSENFSKYKL